MPFHKGTVASGFLGRVPDAPTGLGASLYESAQSVLTWTAPTNNGGSAITDYVVQRSTDNTNWTTFTDPVSATTGATVTGLNAGTLYYFRVAAINTYGTGAYATTSATTGAAPGIPTGVSGGSGSNGSVAVSWNAVTVLPAVTSYTVAWSTSSSFASTTGTKLAYTNSSTVDGLSNGTTYYFRVLATNTIASSDYSSISTGATPYTIPTVTIGSTTNFNQNRATFNASFSNGGSAITLIEWRLGTDGSSFGGAISSGTTTYYNATGLSVDTNQYAQVRATNAAGTTGWSATSPVIKTWRSIPFTRTTSGSETLPIPTITPTGGSAIVPSLREIFVAAGGGGAGRSGGGAGGTASSAETAFLNTSNLTVTISVGGGGGTTTAGTGSSLSASGSFTAISATGGGAGSASNIGTGGSNGNATFTGGGGGYGLGYDIKTGPYEDTSQYGAGGGAGWDGAGGAYSNSNAVDPYSSIIGGNGGAGGGPAYGIEGGAGGRGAGTGGNGADGAKRSGGVGNGGNAPDGSGSAGAVTFKYYGP